MTNREILDKFRAKYIGNRQVGTGFGLGGNLDAPPGIVVFITNDNEEIRANKVKEYKENLPKEFEGLPVYIKGMEVPKAY